MLKVVHFQSVHTIDSIIIVVVGVDGVLVIIIPGLGFASIALFPEGVVEILAVDTDPVALSVQWVGVEELAVELGVGFDRGEVVGLHKARSNQVLLL